MKAGDVSMFSNSLDINAKWNTNSEKLTSKKHAMQAES